MLKTLILGLFCSQASWALSPQDLAKVEFQLDIQGRQSKIYFKENSKLIYANEDCKGHADFVVKKKSEANGKFHVVGDILVAAVKCNDGRTPFKLMIDLQNFSSGGKSFGADVSVNDMSWVHSQVQRN